MHELSQHVAELPEVDDWLAGDDRVLAFRVVDSDGDGVDITNATVEWSLFERAYQTDAADAVLSGQDSGVEIVTDSRVNSSEGEFEVRIDGDATADLWGSFTHRPVVEQSDGSRASWKGDVTITA